MTQCSGGLYSQQQQPASHVVVGADAPEKILFIPGTLQPLPREIRTPFSTLVKDLISLALAEKKGALEGLFILPGSSSPTT